MMNITGKIKFIDFKDVSYGKFFVGADNKYYIKTQFTKDDVGSINCVNIKNGLFNYISPDTKVILVDFVLDI